MKIQFAVPVKVRGVDAVDQDSKKPVTLGGICCVVLDSVFQEEAQEGLKPKLRRAELVDKIAAAEEAKEPLDLLDSDVEMIKERIGKRNFPPTLTAAAVRLLVEAA